MARNNMVKLIGNLGAPARTHKIKKGLMSAFYVATHDSYRNAKGEWVEKAPIWHNCLAYRPELIERMRGYPKGTRLELEGSLSYKEFFHTGDKGGQVRKREASVVVHKVDERSLPVPSMDG